MQMTFIGQNPFKFFLQIHKIPRKLQKLNPSGWKNSWKTKHNSRPSNQVKLLLSKFYLKQNPQINKHLKKLLQSVFLQLNAAQIAEVPVVWL